MDGVELDNPDINITCNELEIHFKEEAADDGGDAEAAAVEDAVAEAGGAAMSGGSNIEIAYARGRKVVLEKKNPDGKIQIGQCREAVYDADTGDLILKDWPQVQDGNNLVIATAQHTVITIAGDGSLNLDGPADTKVNGN